MEYRLGTLYGKCSAYVFCRNRLQTWCRYGNDLQHAKPKVEFLEYTPQHKLCILPEGDEELTPKKLQKLIREKLPDRTDDKLDDNFVYLVLKVKLEKVSNDDIKELEAIISKKNAVLCKIQK